MKTNFKRLMSLLLAIIMAISVMPYGTITVFAAYENNYKNTGNQRVDIVEIAKTQIGNTNGNKYGYGSWCAHFVIWCARQANVGSDIIETTGFACADDMRVPYYSRESYMPKAGDLVFFNWPSTSSSWDHVGIVEKVYDDGRVQTIEGNNIINGVSAVRRRTYSNNGASEYSRLSSIRGYGVPNYKNKSYKITVNNSTNIANTSATISATLNARADIQKWGYYISKNKSDVANIDGVNNASKTHADTKTMDYCRVNDWSNSPQSKKDLSVKVNKILGKDLTSNTTYYYKFVVKIGGQWYQSGVKSFKTAAIKPKATTLKVSNTYTDIGIKDTATVTWSAASGADTYTVKLFNSSNKEVYSKSGIKGTSLTFPASCFTSAGTYNAKLYAVNAAGTTACSGNPAITVHKNVTVTFYDIVSKKNISKQSVIYGHNADAPANPSQTGYTFKKWDKSYSKVKSDITVNTVYETNKYTVKFVDGYSNETISSDKYSFNTVLDSDDYPTAPEHKNYKFIGWSEDKYKVGAETHTIYARYEWDLPTDIGTEIKSIERAKSDYSETTNDGYNVTVKVSVPAGTTKTIKGRVVVALKTANGRLLIETESAAFVLYPSETKEQNKEIEVFVPYEAAKEDLAAVTEVYVVNDYNSAGIISNTVSDTIKTAASNADEWQFSKTKPVIGENGVERGNLPFGNKRGCYLRRA